MWIIVLKAINTPLGRAALGCLAIAVLAFSIWLWGNSRHDDGRREREQEYVVQERDFLLERTKVIAALLEATAKRAAEDALIAEENSRKARDAAEIARALPDANRVCLPSAVTDRLREIN